MVYLAVYGSLLRAEGMLDRLGVGSQLRFVGAAGIPGRLFDLGEFPGLVSPGETAPEEYAALGAAVVPGELFEVMDAGVLGVLDEYEGYDLSNPGESPFVRRLVRLGEPAGVEAWVYFYMRSIAGCVEISGQAWSDYKAVRRSAEGGSHEPPHPTPALSPLRGEGVAQGAR